MNRKMVIKMSDNRCVFCGEQIPEGTQVCPNCVKKNSGIHNETPEEKVNRILDDWVIPIGLIALIIVFYILFVR